MPDKTLGKGPPVPRQQAAVHVLGVPVPMGKGPPVPRPQVEVHALGVPVPMGNRRVWAVFSLMFWAWLAGGEGQTAPNPLSAPSGYTISMMGEYPPGSRKPKITLTFSKDGKKLFSHILQQPVKKSAIAGNGRSFFELEDGEIRGYERWGGIFLTQRGKALVASPGGKFIAFRPLEAKGKRVSGSLLVLGVESGEKHKFAFGDEPIAALTDDGGYIVVRHGPLSSFQGLYSIFDNQGRAVWKITQPCQFLKEEGKWILFVTNNGKTVKSREIKTGKTVMEMPIRRYNALYNAPPPRRP